MEIPPHWATTCFHKVPPGHQCYSTSREAGEEIFLLKKIFRPDWVTVGLAVGMGALDLSRAQSYVAWLNKLQRHQRKTQFIVFSDSLDLISHLVTAFSFSEGVHSGTYIRPNYFSHLPSKVRWEVEVNILSSCDFIIATPDHSAAIAAEALSGAPLITTVPADVFCLDYKDTPLPTSEHA